MLKKVVCFILCSLIFINKFLEANSEMSEEHRYFYTNEFLAGYLQAKLDDRFPNMDIGVVVQGGEITVYCNPMDEAICENIRCYLEELEGVSNVVFERSFERLESLSDKIVMEEGNWLPELTPFFPTLLADPRIIGYSVGYRTYDRVFKTPLLPISIGDRFSLYQFKNIADGRLYLGIETCVWAIFEAKSKSLSLINADYYIGIPVTYINDRLSLRLRIFHQSSHLGDELLVENSSIHRLNPSMEAIDFYAAYDFTKDFTLFGGVGTVIRHDKSYKVKPWYIAYGFNYQINVYKLCFGGLEASPYLGVYFSQCQDGHWRLASTVVIGYQWDKSYGRKLRLYVEGHDGFSSEGQFSKQRTRYVALKLLYGY